MADARRIGAAAATLLALSGLVGGVAGCSGSSSSGSSNAVGGGSAAVQDGGLALSSSRAAGHAAEPAERSASFDLPQLRIGAPRIPSAVIKTADIGLRVRHGRVTDAMDRIRGVIRAIPGAYESHSDVTHTGQRSATIVLRVPSTQFQRALGDIQRVGLERYEQVEGRDVSQEFIDLNARLVNLRAQERVLRRLMIRAQSINASILVENQLSQVQLQIETVTGRILYLRNRADFSTITVNVAEAHRAAPVHDHASTLWKAGRDAVNSAVSVVVTVIVGAGYVVPLALLALLALLAGRRLWPRAAALGGQKRGAADA